MSSLFLSTPIDQQKWLMRLLIVLCVILALVAGYAFESRRLAVDYFEKELSACQQLLSESDKTTKEE